jgi:hypothetical protein
LIAPYAQGTKVDYFGRLYSSMEGSMFLSVHWWPFYPFGWAIQAKTGSLFSALAFSPKLMNCLGYMENDR